MTTEDNSQQEKEPAPSADSTPGDLNEAEGIRLARADLQAKLANPPEGEDADTLDTFGGKRVQHPRDEESHPLETMEDTSGTTTTTILGAVAVDGSANDHSSRITSRIRYSSTDASTRDLVQQVQQPTQPTTRENLLEATLVVEEEEEEDPAKVVTAEQMVCGFSTNQWWYLAGCVGVLVAVIVVGAVLLVRQVQSSNDNNNALSAPPVPQLTIHPTPTPLPTLQEIRRRDVLRCGVWDEANDFFNFAKIYEAPEDQVDFLLCRAYAAAILGNASKYQIVGTSMQDNLSQLAQGDTIDLLLSHVETGMQANVWEPSLQQGFAFSSPYVYTDLVLGGLPHFVQCAEDDWNARGNCSGLKVCTNDKSAYFTSLASQLPESHLVKRNDTLDIILGFLEGDCNVVPSENSGIMEWGLDMLGYKGEYRRGTRPFAKDVVTVATRSADVEFSDFCNLILLGLLAAEQADVTPATAQVMADSAVLGDELVEAVRAVGSYKDLYQRGVAPVMKQEDSVWNLINNGTTGLMYSLPLGKVRTTGPGPVAGGTLERIWKRQDRKLHCGIQPNRPGFASLNEDGNWVGMDIEYCTALAASVLEGEAQAIHFVPLQDETDGFFKLQSGEVDVLAGFTWNVINDYREPTTEEGYSFTQPYFYRPLEDFWSNSSDISWENEGDNRCLVTRQDDVQFSNFVYWTVASTFYASERGIASATANNMPDVNLFGDDYIKMFRDAIYFAGSYDEIYQRNLGERLLERGRNAINRIRAPGPQHYVPPGFLWG